MNAWKNRMCSRKLKGSMRYHLMEAMNGSERKREWEIRLGNSGNRTNGRKRGLAIDEVVNMRAIGSFAIMWIVFLWVSVRMSGINCNASTAKLRGCATIELIRNGNHVKIENQWNIFTFFRFSVTFQYIRNEKTVFLLS